MKNKTPRKQRRPADFRNDVFNYGFIRADSNRALLTITNKTMTSAECKRLAEWLEKAARYLEGK